MNNNSIDDLKSQVAAIERRLELLRQRRSQIPQQPKSDDEADDRTFATGLASMTDQQAATYLRNLQSPQHINAFFILSKKLSDTTMVEICREYLRSPVFEIRFIGVGEIVTYLRATNDHEASHALALIIRNDQEQPPLRLLAYRSLLSINSHETGLLCEIGDVFASRTDEILKNVNWKFIESFL